MNLFFNFNESMITFTKSLSLDIQISLDNQYVNDFICQLLMNIDYHLREIYHQEFMVSSQMK